MQPVGVPYLTSGQRKLLALLNESTRLLPYLSVEDCDVAAKALLPILRTAVKNESDFPASDLDHKHGAELLALFDAPASAPTEQEQGPIRKRGRSVESVDDDRVWPLWSYDTHGNLQSVKSVGRNTPGGPLGLYVTARANGSGHSWEVPTTFFATRDELKRIDGIATAVKRKKLIGILHSDILKTVAVNPQYVDELIAMLQTMDWGQTIARTLSVE
jgi:hypothetical protein